MATSKTQPPSGRRRPHERPRDVTTEPLELRPAAEADVAVENAPFAVEQDGERRLVRRSPDILRCEADGVDGLGLRGLAVCREVGQAVGPAHALDRAGDAAHVARAAGVTTRSHAPDAHAVAGVDEKWLVAKIRQNDPNFAAIVAMLQTVGRCALRYEIARSAPTKSPITVVRIPS